MYIVYSKENCVWCTKAKQLLSIRGLEYTEKKFNVDFTREDLALLLQREFPLTLPQIIDPEGNLIEGGFQGLEAKLKE